MLLGNNQNNLQQGSAAAEDVVFDVNVQDFESRVMQGSLHIPVIVDFWAPWCGPCKQMMPAIEEVVRAAGGQVLLAKVNIDENPELAQALRVQSVPTVFSFFQGQPVDGFTGAKPASEIKAFVEKLLALVRQSQTDALPDELDVPAVLEAAAKAMAEGDLALAQGLYVQILTQKEDHVDAYAGLVRTLIAADQMDQAQQMIEEAPDSIAAAPALEAVKTALALAQSKPSESVVLELAGRIEKNADDHQARFELAEALFAHSRPEEAIDALIEIIRRNRAWEDEKARKQLLVFFEALGPVDPQTIAGRKKLSLILFS